MWPMDLLFVITLIPVVMYEVRFTGVQAECGADFKPAESIYCNQLPTQDCVGSFPGVITTQAPTTTAPPRKSTIALYTKTKYVT